jgi:hypothetical protein
MPFPVTNTGKIRMDAATQQSSENQDQAGLTCSTYVGLVHWRQRVPVREAPLPNMSIGLTHSLTLSILTIFLKKQRFSEQHHFLCCSGR